MKTLVRAILAMFTAVMAFAVLNVGPAGAWAGCLPHFDPETGEIYTLCY